MSVHAVASRPLVDESARGVREVVAINLSWRGKVSLFRRSSMVHHDVGLWHCITGYLDGVTDGPQTAAAARTPPAYGMELAPPLHPGLVRSALTESRALVKYALDQLPYRRKDAQ